MAKTKIKKHELVGGRLKDALKRKNGMEQQALLNEAEKIFTATNDSEFKLNQSNISDVISGGRNLPDKYIDAISEVLEIDPGYLRGADKFRAKTYDEYLVLHLKQEDLRKDFNRYKKMLSLAGAKIVNTIYDDAYNVIAYSIYKDKRTVQFSAADMEKYMTRFYDDICDFASKRFESVMDLGTQESKR